jgi:predicted amidohydrolase
VYQAQVRPRGVPGAELTGTITLPRRRVMVRKVSIAACQFVIQPVVDFDALAGQCSRLLDCAKGADLAFFPELFTLALFTIQPGWRKRAARELGWVDCYTGSYYEFCAGESRRRRQHIVAGSHLE